MLTVLTTGASRFDAGALALAVARRWSDSGEAVLFVDAGTADPGLAQRLGGVEHVEYSPAQRGLPSLMVCRQPLTLRLLADHCYSLDTEAGSLWALFGPHHPNGAEYAARWLGSRSAELAEVDAQRNVVVSSSLPACAETLAPVLWASTPLVVVAPVETMEEAKGLWSLMRDLRLSRRRCRHRALIVEGDPDLADDEIGIEAGMRVAGRLPVVDDESVLRRQGGRRERAFAKAVDQIARRLLAFTQLVSSDSGNAGATGTAPAAPGPAPARQPQPGAPVNGSSNGPSPPAQPHREARHEGRV